MASPSSEDACQDSAALSLSDLESLHHVRSRSASFSSTGSSGRLQLRQRVAQLMACVEDISSDDEINEEVSRTLDEAFLIWGKKLKDKWQEFRLHLVTWNVGTASPPPDVSSLLQLDSLGTTMDMYVIGLQEVNSKITNFLSDLAFDDPWSIFLMTVLSPLGYIKLSSVRMQGLLLLIFVKHVHLPFIRDLHTQFTRTGLYGYWGNKGGVTIRMSLYGHTVCFMNCHLPAHMENTEQRLDDFEKILEMQFEGENIPSALEHDVLFWFGDLNFRIADYGMHFVRESINNKRYNLLWEKDQLKPLVSEPLVTLSPEGEWSAEHDVLINYSAVPEFPSSAWDWIGLFKVTFKHVNDYVTYSWVEDDEISSNKDGKQVYMSAAEIPDAGGEFLLCFYSNNLQSVVGVSQPFQIQPNRTLIGKELPQEDDSWMQRPDNLESHDEF
ncbi:inositol polyphosphate 5-phosphatase K isoform X6 [Pezoporus wallicus]|uniref:inositol polyphosphate 5-phosphatase K isoform X6 n=1 Tax=Pezoporus wallicus TaxID=35540 RepID=UPI00254AF45B|nr:inositol polyphosphate 5-phosphatase K isoform X6 [Pezoporus wallicus]